MRAGEALKKDVDKTGFRVPTFMTAVSVEQSREQSKKAKVSERTSHMHWTRNSIN